MVKFETLAKLHMDCAFIFIPQALDFMMGKNLYSQDAEPVSHPGCHSVHSLGLLRYSFIGQLEEKARVAGQVGHKLLTLEIKPRPLGSQLALATTTPWAIKGCISVSYPVFIVTFSIFAYSRGIGFQVEGIMRNYWQKIQLQLGNAHVIVQLERKAS